MPTTHTNRAKTSDLEHRKLTNQSKKSPTPQQKRLKTNTSLPSIIGVPSLQRKSPERPSIRVNQHALMPQLILQRQLDPESVFTQQLHLTGMYEAQSFGSNMQTTTAWQHPTPRPFSQQIIQRNPDPNKKKEREDDDEEENVYAPQDSPHSVKVDEKGTFTYGNQSSTEDVVVENNTEVIKKRDVTGGVTFNPNGQSFGINGGITNTNTVKDVGSDDPILSQSTSLTGGVTGDLKDKKFGGNVGYTQSTEIDGQKQSRGVTGSGTLDFTDDGRLEGVNGNVGLSRNSTTVTIGGGILVTATKPKLEGSKYLVTWKRVYTGSLGGGHSKEFSGGERKGSVSLGYTGKSSTTGKRYFTSKKAADSFYKGQTWKNIDPDNARQLAQGDTITQSSNHEGTVGLTGQLAGLTIGGSLKLGSGHSVEITGLGEQRVSVKIKDTSVFGANGSVGAPGLALTAGMQSSVSSGLIVTFNLGTAAGRNAFGYLRQNGKLHPNKRGYTLKATIHGTENQESIGISAVGATLNNTSTVSENTTVYTDGNTLEERVGTESTKVTIPLLGSYSASDSFNATDNSKDKSRKYTVKTTVSGSSAQDVNQKLARAVGVGYDTNVTDAAKQSTRIWTVSYRFTQAQIRRLIFEIAVKNNWNASSLIHASGHGRALAATAKAATNWDTIDRALTEFISETGDRGLALIRSTISATPQFSISLKDDPYLTGESGHTRLSKKVRGWKKRLDAKDGPGEVGTLVAEELSRQRQRLRMISSTTRYPDLPGELRIKEVKRTRKEVKSLEALQKRAISIKQQLELAQEQAEREVCNPDINYTPVSDSVLANSEWETVNTLQTSVEGKREKAIQVGNQARRGKWIQVGGAYVGGVYGRVTAHQKWGQRSMFGDGEHADLYDLAASHLKDGYRAWNKAEEYWTAYRKSKGLIEALSYSEQVGNIESTLSVTLNRALRKYGAAARSFGIAHAKYESVRKAHPDIVYGPFNAYAYNKQLPDKLSLP